MYQQSFINEEIGDILKDAFEGGEQRVVKVLEDYMHHNDYLMMKNQLQAIGEELYNTRGEDEQSDQKVIFPNLNIALGWYLTQGKLTQDEFDNLQRLSETKFESFIPLWEAYKQVKDLDELLEDLKLLIV